MEIEGDKNRKAVEETDVCPTRLIEDLPSEEDQFASTDGIGPHERVARAIADVILSPSESGGKMIGLEGEWGAGKTTVVGLLKKRLDKNGGVTVFTYDAWAHEGDPLRRTFLEALIQHLRSINWIDLSKSQQTLDEIANRRSESSTRTIPKTTKFGRNLAISLFLMPIGSPFLTESLRRGITFDSTLPITSISLLFVTGIIFTGAPIWVLIREWCRILWPRWKARKNREKPWYRHNKNTDEMYAWSFLQGQATTETTQLSIKTPDPTSIEFERYFCRWMKEALENHPNRKAVMVLDNLDRVDPKDALSIWSTLQTFLQLRNDRADRWFSKLWIVIPYDPHGLRNLWTTKGTEGEETLLKGDCQSVPESFMDKSFQLRFRVPPLVLSNWKAYLETLTSKALPSHKSEDLHKIYLVFSMTRPKDKAAPTPRELKLYVNQLGAIHRQWQHEFPLEHIAYYTILCRRDVNIREELLKGKLLEPAIQSILPPNIVASLAGLYFNVPASLGQQLLLADPIANALGEGDIKQLEQLEKTHNVGFWAVLETVMTEKRAGGTAKKVANVALCLDSLQILNKQPSNERNTILAALKDLALGIDVWVPFDKDIASGISAVCRLVSDSECSRHVLTKLRETIANPKLTEQVHLTEETIQTLAKICEEITQIGHSDTLQPFVLVANQEEWVRVCPYIHEQSEQWWALFAPQANGDDISNALKAIVVGGKFSEETLATIEVTHRSLKNCDWTSLASAIEGRLSASQNPTNTETNFLLQGLSLLRRLGCAQVQRSLELLATNGHLMHRLHQAQSQQDVACTARLLTTFLERRPKAEKPNPIGTSEAGYKVLLELLSSGNPDLAKHIVGILDAESEGDMLFKIADERGDYDPLIVVCLRLISDSDAPGRLFTPNVVIDRWYDLWDKLNTKDDAGRFDRLIGYLCVNSNLVETVMNAESGFNYKDAWLYFRICKAFSSQTFRDWCRLNLESLDSEAWESQLEKKGNVIDLFLFLIDNGVHISLTLPFQDALAGYARKVLTGSTMPSDKLIEQWPKLLNSLKPASRKALRRRLLSEAKNKEGKCADAFFQIYGDELATDTTLFYEEKDAVANLLSPLLRERTVSGLRWLSSLFKKNPDLLDKSLDKDAVEDFLDRLKEERRKPVDEGDEAHTLIIDIAVTLGIPTEIANDAKESDVTGLKVEEVK